MYAESSLSAQLLALTQLQNLSLRLGASLALDDTLDAIIEAAMTICRADRAAISQLNDHGELVLMHHRGLSDEYIGARQLTRFDPAIEQIVTNKEPLIIEDVEKLAGVSANYDAWKREGIGSIVTLPLLGEGKVFGVLGAGASTPRRYSKTDTDAMAVLATQASAAIVNARLFEQLRLANRAKDEFLSTLSHELRTPLTPILGWMHLLKPYAALEPLLAEGIQTVERNANQLAGLIEDLLDLTRIVSGKMELARAATDLAPLVESVFAQHEAQADEQGVRLQLRLPAVPVVSEVDPVRLQQVVANLLSNAVKFTPDGGAVTATLKREAGRAVIEVADTGIGIAADFLPHIFERFAQAHGGINRQYGGLGLGLAIARAMVEAHGGEISAASDGAHRGSLFKVTLPLARRTGPLAADASPGFVAELTPEHLGLRVLVIEDSPDTLTLLRLWLTTCGCEAITATDAAEGVRLAAAHRPDVIISDIGLPNIDGYELMRRIREIAELAQVPAIALTGYARREDRDQALAAGYTAHIAKPVPMPELLQLVKELTRR
jgi:signal transduction histidine kinase